MILFRRIAIAAALHLGALSPAFADAEAVVSAPAARTLQTEGKLSIIDVRTPQEWRESGIPAGAATVTFPGDAGVSFFVAEVLRQHPAIGTGRSR